MRWPGPALLHIYSTIIPVHSIISGSKLYQVYVVGTFEHTICHVAHRWAYRIGRLSTPFVAFVTRFNISSQQNAIILYQVCSKTPQQGVSTTSPYWLYMPGNSGMLNLYALFLL